MAAHTCNPVGWGRGIMGSRLAWTIEWNPMWKMSCLVWPPLGLGRETSLLLIIGLGPVGSVRMLLVQPVAHRHQETCLRTCREQCHHPRLRDTVPSLSSVGGCIPTMPPSPLLRKQGKWTLGLLFPPFSGAHDKLTCGLVLCLPTWNLSFRLSPHCTFPWRKRVPWCV